MPDRRHAKGRRIRDQYVKVAEPLVDGRSHMVDLI